MNDITLSTPATRMQAARAEYLADLKARAQSKGEAHGQTVGLATKRVFTHTRDTVSTGTTATTGYVSGFGKGFISAFRG